MIETGTANLIGFTILALSLLFAYAGTLETCTYRKYIVPGMLLLVSIMLLPETVAAIMVAVSAVLIYSGYKEYGIKARKEAAKENKKEDGNEDTGEEESG